MNARFQAVIYATVLLTILRTYGEGAASDIERETLSSRAYKTWESTYKFSEECIIRIEGKKNIHLLIYRCADKEGTLIDFAQAVTDKKLLLLRGADLNVKGVTPIYEGIDVLVGADEAEIIIRWRHPGQGGERLIEKYCYNENGVRLINRSHFGGARKREMRWVSDETANHSTPAERIPIYQSRGVTNEIEKHYQSREIEEIGVKPKDVK